MLLLSLNQNHYFLIHKMIIIELRNLHLESGCEVLPGVVKLVGSMFDSDDDYDGEGDDGLPD